MKNVFIVPKGLSAGVIHSQIKEMVYSLNKICESKNTIAIHKNDINKLPEANVSYRSLFYFLINQSDIDFIYIRSVFDFLAAYLAKKIAFKKYKILYDFRGIINEESFIRHGSQIRKRILYELEYFVYKRADKIHTVSHHLKEYLLEHFGNRDSVVIPCAIKTNRLKKRVVMDRIEFVYVGSVRVWQRFDETLKLYKYIEDRFDKTNLTIITLDTKIAQKSVQKCQLAKYEIKSMSHEQVLDDLIHYDFGFLLRDDTIVNRTASPIKFLEYISNGVIPIMNRNIGDYSAMVEQEGIGIILDENDSFDIEIIKNFLSDDNILQKIKKISDNYLWSEVLIDVELQ
jgi:glycosyltransferase involved in cell wall biosynthesis